MFTIERRIWNAPPPHIEDTDYTGQWRWVVLDDGLVYDHFATEEEAQATADRLTAEELDADDRTAASEYAESL